MGPNFLKSCVCVCVCGIGDYPLCNGIFVFNRALWDVFHNIHKHFPTTHTVLFEDLDLKSFSTT